MITCWIRKHGLPKLLTAQTYISWSVSPIQIEKEDSENRKILVARQGMWYYSKESFYYCISISSVKLLIEWCTCLKERFPDWSQKTFSSQQHNKQPYEIEEAESKYIHALYGMKKFRTQKHKTKKWTKMWENHTQSSWQHPIFNQKMAFIFDFLHWTDFLWICIKACASTV